MTCRHRRTAHKRWQNGAWSDTAYGVNCWPGWLGTRDAAVVCGDCSAWLPLGPSNDEGCEVEIEAARIAMNDGPNGDFTAWNGWDAAVSGEDDHSMGLPEWHAGYLARCIVDHDSATEREGRR